MTSIPKAGVIGWPVSHSLSPVLHGHWLKRHAIEAEYNLIPVEPERIEDFLANFADQGIVGCNVTLPHKQAAFRMAAKASSFAQQLGAANLLWLEDGELIADNTDAHGFIANLDDRVPGWDRAQTALVLGAGGAARAIVAGLLGRNIKRIIILNRTLERAVALSQWFGEEHGSSLSAGPLGDLDAKLAEADLIINTTSAGMAGAPAIAIDWSRAQPSAIATDIVYVPLVTPFLAAAAGAGLVTVDGLGMLLHQAVPAFRTWFGVTPVVDDELRECVLETLRARG